LRVPGQKPHVIRDRTSLVDVAPTLARYMAPAIDAAQDPPLEIADVADQQSAAQAWNQGVRSVSVFGGCGRGEGIWDCLAASVPGLLAVWVAGLSRGSDCWLNELIWTD